MKSWLPIALLLLFVTGCGEPDPAQKAADEARDRKIMAYVMAQDFVEQRLKSPGSADFPTFEESFAEDLGSGKWRVRSYVDSQNSFGALVRSDFTVLLRDDPNSETWHLEDVTINTRL